MFSYLKNCFAAHVFFSVTQLKGYFYKNLFTLYFKMQVHKTINDINDGYKLVHSWGAL